MLIEVFRFIKGSVDFEISGRFPERFLNLAARRGISVINACPSNGRISGRMIAADYRRIRPTAKSSGVRLRITKKRGLPFLARRFRGRLGLPVGFVLGIALLIFLSCFVWSVSIEGAEQTSETKLLRAFEDQGVKVGCFKGRIDPLELRTKLLPELKELSWLSVNVIGSTVRIEVRERSPKPELESGHPCNIVARTDGVITKINAARGKTEIAEGSGVAKGELLVSGVTNTARDEVVFSRARAEVFADVYSEKESYLPKSFDYYSLTENKVDRRRLSILWWEFPASLSFTSYENTAYSESFDSASLGNNSLPLGLRTRTAHEVRNERFTLSRRSAEVCFKNELLLYELFERPDSAVRERKLSITEDGRGYRCSASYIFNEDIAEEKEFDVN